MGQLTSAKRATLEVSLEKYNVLCLAVMRRDGWKCRVCKRRHNLHCHHVVFRSHGGEDAADWNLLTACRDCHRAVHDRLCVVKPVPNASRRIDAGKQVQFEFVSGWTPGMKTVVVAASGPTARIALA